MKKIALFLLAILFNLNLFAQYGEFKLHDNGLIYNDNTVAQLKFIVDSLNLQFKSCEPNKDFKTLNQSIGHYIDLGENKQARIDLEANMPYEKLTEKYPDLEITECLVIVKNFTKYGENNNYEIESIPYNFGYSPSVYLASESYFNKNAKKGSYLLGKDSDEAFYLLEDFKSDPLEEKYSLLVQYVDCLVDTNSLVIHKEATRNAYFKEKKDKIPNNKAWEKIAEKAVGKKDHADDPIFMADLNRAADLSIEKRLPNASLEACLLKYNIADKALELKRLRRVYGMCSMDSGPRIHAQEIAVLAAETVKWDIFLRAHLDIMNDRFDRISDGSWAWEGRKTYIRELEELDIEVVDLLLGASLRIDNASPNHYYASIGRTGRALAESQQLDLIQTQILDMIKDDKLDRFNRMLMYFLFRNIIENVDLTLQAEKTKALQEAIDQLPDYMSSQIVLE